MSLAITWWMGIYFVSDSLLPPNKSFWHWCTWELCFSQKQFTLYPSHVLSSSHWASQWLMPAASLPPQLSIPQDKGCYLTWNCILLASHIVICIQQAFSKCCGVNEWINALSSTSRREEGIFIRLCMWLHVMNKVIEWMFLNLSKWKKDHRSRLLITCLLPVSTFVLPKCCWWRNLPWAQTWLRHSPTLASPIASCCL